MRVRYFFAGKPGVGKTLLAEKLGSCIPSVKILTDSTWNSALEDPFSPQYADVNISYNTRYHRLLILDRVLLKNNV